MTNKISLPKKEKKQYFYTGQHRCLVHISKFNLLSKTVQERKRKGGIEIKYACSRNNVVLGVKYGTINGESIGVLIWTTSL